MKLTCLLFILAALAAHAGPRTSANYAIIAESVDSAGQHTMSASYASDSSLSDVADLSAATGLVAQTAKSGFIAQLYEVIGLQLAAAPAPATVDEGATRQLYGAQLLDDSTLLAVPASSITWSIQSGPLSIDANGLATAAVVYQDTAASVQGGFAGNTGFLGITVINVNNDDIPGYSGDGIADDWQVQYFGLSNPSAAPLLDPDFDGHDNLFEFTAGLAPTDGSSKFSYRIEPVPGQPQQMRVVFSPRWADRNYTILISTTLTAGSWALLSNGIVTDSADERTVTDTNANGTAKFYKVQIIKP